MRVTIIPSDGFVSVDGEGRNDIDLSFIDSNIHAIQWYDTDGEIEIKDNRGRVITNQQITDLSPYQQALDMWQAKKNDALAEEELARSLAQQVTENNTSESADQSE
jgi:hypothetical protein